MRMCGWVLGGVTILGLGQGIGLGQTAAVGMGTDSARTPGTMEASLHAMSDRAAVVFLGTVTSVRRVGADPSSTAAGVVEVEFAVERAVRGCVTGGTYTLREWAGLWAGTTERYRVGERMFMMLHAPGPSGLSSPVGGAQGMMPVHGGGGTVGERDRGTGAGIAVVDLRWVGAKLARPVVYRKEAPRGPRVGREIAAPMMADEGSAVSTVARVTNRRPAVGAEEAAAAALAEPAPQASVPAQEAGVPALVEMLASWGEVADAGR